MTIHHDGESAFLDYREKAPLAADRDMYLDDNGEVIPNSTLIGGQAAAVSGTVAGFWLAHQRFGKLPWRDLLTPAIKLAAEGFRPAPILVESIENSYDWFGDATNFKDYFGKIRSDQLFKQPELAATLERIAESGPEDFLSW